MIGYVYIYMYIYIYMLVIRIYHDIYIYVCVLSLIMSCLACVDQIDKATTGIGNCSNMLKQKRPRTNTNNDNSSNSRCKSPSTELAVCLSCLLASTLSFLGWTFVGTLHIGTTFCLVCAGPTATNFLRTIGGHSISSRKYNERCNPAVCQLILKKPQKLGVEGPNLFLHYS